MWKRTFTNYCFHGMEMNSVSTRARRWDLCLEAENGWETQGCGQVK